MKQRYFLLNKNMTGSWILIKYSCRRMMRGCQWKEKITKQGCRIPSCNSRNSIIFETKRFLQILQREILAKKLRITYLLQVILKRTLLKNTLWKKEGRRKMI
jgi:hypothetical protein